MSRHREMLRALVWLGKTSTTIASEVPINLANVSRTLLSNWPIQKRYVESLEDYAINVFRAAYSTAGSIRKRKIAECYLQVFGEAIEDAPDLTAWAKGAAYVAWLLCLSPLDVFPFGPEWTEDANQHLVDFVVAELEKLKEQAAKSRDFSEAARQFRSTLNHCNKIMSGEANPADNGWAKNNASYRQGRYVFQEGCK